MVFHNFYSRCSISMPLHQSLYHLSLSASVSLSVDNVIFDTQNYHYNLSFGHFVIKYSNPPALMMCPINLDCLLLNFAVACLSSCLFQDLFILLGNQISASSMQHRTSSGWLLVIPLPGQQMHVSQHLHNILLSVCEKITVHCHVDAEALLLNLEQTAKII